MTRRRLGVLGRSQVSDRSIMSRSWRLSSSDSSSSLGLRLWTLRAPIDSPVPGRCAVGAAAVRPPPRPLRPRAPRRCGRRPPPRAGLEGPGAATAGRPDGTSTVAGAAGGRGGSGDPPVRGCLFWGSGTRATAVGRWSGAFPGVGPGTGCAGPHGSGTKLHSRFALDSPSRLDCGRAGFLRVT